MPKSTLLKIVLSQVVVFILLIVLWFALPFPPTASRSLKHEYIQNALQSGSRITTVYTKGRSFESRDDLLELPEPISHRPFNPGVFNRVILSWQLRQDSETSSIFLEIGSRTSPNFSASVNLTDLATQSPDFLTQRFELWTPAGDDSEFCPSYFDLADTTLIYHETFDTWQAVRLRFLVGLDGTVQVWKDLQGWESYSASDLSSIDDADRLMGLLATFDLTETLAKPASSLSSVKVVYLGGWLPTRTYAIRRLIIVVTKPLINATSAVFGRLEPVFLIIGRLLQYTVLIVTIYFLVAIVCWNIWGHRRPFVHWAQDFWLTRKTCRVLIGPPAPKIWTASGPMQYDYEEKGKATTSARQIEPLTGALGFFTSNSPLDSLLVSFESTRWMVKPLPVSRYREKSSSH